MNLISDAWLPVLLRSGEVAIVAPSAIAGMGNCPVRCAFARPDWNLAGLELLIGLTYLAAPPADEDDWEERAGRHSETAFAEQLDPLARWFSLDATEGPRFLQDLESLAGARLPCDRLFIDAPGEKTVKDNGDLLVKRTPGLVLSRATAAIALYAFQQFAPSGGAGNRTSMRGGGPMVTLVEPKADASLMDVVWANVPNGRPLDTADDAAVAAALPWTVATRTSGSPSSTVHEPENHGDGPCGEQYFGMPRRIRLEFGSAGAKCALSGITDERPVVGFQQTKHGTDYGQWLHPHTPYYRMKEGSEQLAVHPKPGRFGYRHYRGIVLKDPGGGLRDRATCVDTYERERNRGKEPARLIVGGWAMENMRALDFVFSVEPAPLSSLSVKAEQRVVRAIEAAEILAGSLSVALKNALDVEPKGTDVVSSARRRFYELTDGAFQRLVLALTSDPDDAVATDIWRKALLATALRLFDQSTLDLVPVVSPERARKILDARRLILASGTGYSKSGGTLFGLLDLDPPEKSPKKSKSKENSEA